MPRLPPKLLLRAHRQDPLLPLLLRECRDLVSARNELRWLRSHAQAEPLDSKSRQRKAANNPQVLGWRARLRSMCQARSKGKPLQYILGDQPFGDLEILCREGVLIPRSETETYTICASQLISRHLRQESGSRPSATDPLRILDLCTGTGCIPLLLHQLLSPHFPKLEIAGVDISQKAVTLAKKNLEHNVRLGLLTKRATSEIRFVKDNILDCDVDAVSLGGIFDRRECRDRYQGHKGEDAGSKNTEMGGTWDILISNPPYISPAQFGNGTTARSVRFYEPKLALVPPTAMPNGERKPSESNQTLHVEHELAAGTGLDSHADTFYPRLISISSLIKAKLSVFECGDPQQAQRVAELAARHKPAMEDLEPKLGAKDCEAGNEYKVEVWRCDDEFRHGDDTNPSEGDEIQGDKGARAVVLKRKPFLP